MAITIPNTFVDGETIDAARQNANFSEIATKALDKTGDTMTGDLNVPDEAVAGGWNGSTEVPTKNAVYDGFVLKAGDTMTGDLNVPDEAYDATSWNGSTEVPTKNAVRDKIEALAIPSGAAKACMAYNSGQQTVATTSATVLTLDSERFDTDTMHSTSANTGRLTAPATGKYTVTAVVTLNAMNNPACEVRVRKNGATYLGGWRATIVSTNVPQQSIGGVMLVDLTATDYLELVAVHSSSDTVTYGQTDYPVQFGMAYIGS